MIKLSIVIPVYNEEKRIDKTLKEVEEFLDKQTYGCEVIFVDDGSSDSTKSHLAYLPRRQAGRISHIANTKLISYQPNRGKGYAVKKGVLAAKGENILFCDADMSTPMKEINKLLPFIEKYPVVIGSRYLKKESIKIKQPFIRRVLSRLGHFFINIGLGFSYADTQCGFKLFQNKPAKEIFQRLTIERWGFDMEILAIAAKLNYSVKEVAVNWYDDPNSRLRAGKAAYNTLKELFKIRYNLIRGQYNGKISAK